jgi:hypothetical protein
MHPTIKLIAAFALGFAIPAMAASNQPWYAAHAAKAKSCAVLEKAPVGAPYTTPSGGAAKTCPTD